MYLSSLFLSFLWLYVMVIASLPICIRLFFIILLFRWAKHLISPIALRT